MKSTPFLKIVVKQERCTIKGKEKHSIKQGLVLLVIKLGSDVKATLAAPW